MKLKVYEEKYKNQLIALVLYLQNFDNKVDLSLEEQPDINMINDYYIKTGGCFWIALDEDDNVTGTIGLLKKGNFCVLKKFFVDYKYRGREYKTAQKLYDKFEEFAKNARLNAIILDTPAACHRAHGFYLKNGFKKILKKEVPVKYDFPDRSSIFFIKNLTSFYMSEQKHIE